MKKITLVITILMLICIATNVYATETIDAFSIEAQTDSNDVSKEQKQVTIDIYLRNYQGDGTLGYEGKLEYDKDIFESVTITASDEWDKVVYDTTTGKFVSTTIEAKTDTKIAQIILSLKENVNAETTQVGITDLIISDGTIEDTLDKSITYTFLNDVKQEENLSKSEEETEVKLPNIEVDTTTKEEETIKENKEENDEETPKQLTVESVQKNSTDETKAQTTIPQTGTSMFGTIIIVAILVLGIIGYIKYRSIELK